MSATSEEDKSNAAVQLHIAHFEFPADHLAPWGSILDKPQVAGIAALKNIADVGTELSRREWLDAHPGEPIPEKMESAHPDNEDGDEEDAPEFELDRVRGGAEFFGWCANNYAQHVHDLAPSIGGLGRRQGIGWAGAMKSGLSVEPPQKRTFFQKITGRNKESQQVSGGT